MNKRLITTLAVTLALVAMILGRHFRPSEVETGYDIASFSELPVQVGGRIKPLDSVARNTLLILSARQKVETPDGKWLKPIEWFMDLTMRPQVADTYRVFKIEFPDDLGLPGLAEQGQRYYSFNDLRPHFGTIVELYSKVDPEPERRSAYDKQIVDLNNGLMLYHRVMHSLHPIGSAERLDSLVDEYREFRESIAPGLQALSQQQAGEDFDADVLNRFIFFGDDYLKLSQTAHLRVVPPPPPVEPLADWINIGEELLGVIEGKPLSPYVTGYATLTMAYRSGSVETFNHTVEDIRQQFIADFPDDIDRVHFERLFNDVQPFGLAMYLYILVFLMICISWLRWPREIGKVAFWLLFFTFILHTAGLISRMYIQERYFVFVTNLYTSAVFVGWGAALLGLVIERIFRNGVGAAMAALVGFCTLIVAHHLAMTGDTLEMMRAVLDSNFWLATHVTVITMGYSAMFLAGALGICFALSGLFSPRFNKDSARRLGSMVYGITCFGTLFSLVGTILGGIWADQSWGRFWGWDPKENGALMIVIMGAIYLHARWGGIFKERGLMAVAICGNIITSWSWFGTNMLGVGLHSYGFMDQAFFWLLAFVLSQLVFIGLVLLPWNFWRSEFGREKRLKERKRLLENSALNDATS